MHSFDVHLLVDLVDVKQRMTDQLRANRISRILNLQLFVTGLMLDQAGLRPWCGSREALFRFMFEGGSGCRMNEQWSSSAGVCVQAQSEQQRQLAVSQQPRSLAAIPDASPGSSAPFQLYARPTPSSASASHCAPTPGGFARPHSILANGLPPNCTISTPRKGEEAEQLGGCMCVPTSSKSAGGSDEEGSSSRKSDSIVNAAVASTSWITSVQVGDSDAVQVIVSPAALRLQQLPQPPPATYVAEDASTNAARVPPVYDARTANHEINQQIHENNSGSDFRHEVMPSTSAYGPPPAKRKSYEIDGTRGPASNGNRITAHEQCAPAHCVPAGGASSARQPNPSSQNVNNNSPLLVNLLRSTSPGAGAGMNAPHAQSHAPRPPTTPVAPQMSTPPSQSQSCSAGFSPYPYMPRTPMAATPAGPPSVQMRPPPTSGEVVQQMSSSSHMQCEQQQPQHQTPPQQSQIMQQQMNVERQRQIMASQQQSSQAQQVPQQGYYPPAQYPQQQRGMAPGYVLRGGAHAQQAQGVLYATQQGQAVRAQYVRMQQQATLAAHSLPPHYRQSAPLEQAAPPPPKKRKRPTKKQQKEAEIAQQAAAVQQQQQYMMEQQINARVPPTNAHTVDRPNIMPQMLQGGQPQTNMVYAQQSRPYAPSSMQSPSASASAANQMMQSPSTNAVYYQQQQQQQQQQRHIWSAQQQQMMQPQRATQMVHSQQPQMTYPSQMQQQWQSAQSHPQRVAYPQSDNGTEMIASSSGSVHQSPAANRNNPMDFSPSSQSSSTVSPLYHQQQQQQQHMMYQQQMATSQQTPPSGNVPYASQQPSSQQRDTQMQQQQRAYPHEQQPSQQKNASLMDTSGDFGMQDDLGANIADDCGDFNDLDSIEPMTESGDVGTTLMATHQQQMQQQQRQQHAGNEQAPQQTVMTRQAQQQGGYGVPAQMHHAAHGYEQMVQGTASSSHQMMCGPPGPQSKCAPPRQQQQAPSSYGVQQQHYPQQRTSPMQGYSMQQQQQIQVNAGYGVQQPCTSQSGGYPSEQISSPAQSMNAAYATQQQSQYQQQQQPQHQQQHAQQQHYQQEQQQQQSVCASRTSSAGYMPPQPAHQQHKGPGSISTGTSPVVHQQMPSTARQSEDPQTSQSEERATPFGSRSESGVITEREKDPINSTIESVVMRALSDQDALAASSTNGPPNRLTVQRGRVVHSVQPSSSVESTSSGKMMGSAINSVSVKRQASQPSVVSRPAVHGQQQQQQHSSLTAAEVAPTGSSGSPRSLNGRPSSVDGRTSASSSSALTHQLTSIASSHISRRASTSSAGVCEITEESDASASFANGQKDRKMSDSVMSAPEQRLNSANYMAQHHLTNGHDPHLMKEFCFVQQQPNGLSNCVLNDEERHALNTSQQQTLTAQRTPPKSAPRRNRRKADLAQEASPHRDDDDEFFLSAATNTQR
ncbi:unnamed protein product [Toxocara canis]|uniref:Protein kinase domain-containing protein n=1 Tax=Toxocara canis TaxID=6265 RepID=A0A183UP53_TOXCA|nr:unnamed protein product [Toxocara canis]